MRGATGLISVIVTTYNREDALAAVLHALARQSDGDFEVIVADDGSRPATARAIEKARSSFPVPLTHVWHDDRGFQAAEIRNRAVLASSGGYCLFLDGDCIAFPDFVAAHRRLAEPGAFVCGDRVLLSRDLTERILRTSANPAAWRSLAFLGGYLRGEVNRLAPLLRVPLGQLRRRGATRWQGLRSCNIAMWRADLDRVDGFDARFAGWGREDSDLAIRLIRSGCRRKDGRFATGVLHLWHPESDRNGLAENQSMLNETLMTDRVRAVKGLSALTAADGGGRKESLREPQRAAE